MTERDLMVSGFSRHRVRTCVHVTDSNVVMADGPFSPKRNDKYNLGQKQNLRQKVFEIQVRSRSRAKEALGPEKEKKHVAPSLSFKSKAVRVFSFTEEYKV